MQKSMRNSTNEQTLALVVSDREMIMAWLGRTAQMAEGLDELTAHRIWAERKRVENLIGNLRKNLP
jgi:hypothetical protein